MYPSGVWRGFWHQEHYGRQSMSDFRLRFHNGVVTGSGTDIVGAFVFRGEFDPANGRLRMVKQYLGKHFVEYRGSPDGEGSIMGMWSIDKAAFGVEYTGSFLMQPVVKRDTGEEGIQEIVG